MKLFDKFDAKMIEEEVRSYLEGIDQARLLRDKFLGIKSSVGYIEGPPTLNAEPHIGHLRGRVIKDLWYRFKTMQGHDVVFRAGWDTQGLPIELQAEKLLGLSGSKSENISKVGIDTIVATCKDLIQKNAKKWIEVDELLGMSFDYDKAYWTYKDEYIDLDALLAERERLNEHLQQIIDDQTEPWGVKVTTVEIKDVEIPDRMQHAMARQAEAERERRAKVINAEGEFQAAARLNDAADVISRNPVTIQLRYLQTLMEVSGHQSSTIVFPLPIDVLQPLVSSAARRASGDEVDPAERARLDEALGAARAALEKAGTGPGRLSAPAPEELAVATPEPQLADA